MRDEINNRIRFKRECFIFNLDHSKNNGTHWTCLFVKNGKSIYFDPCGIQPPLEIVKYCSSIPDDRRKPSSFRIQKQNEVICGHLYLQFTWAK